MIHGYHHDPAKNDRNIAERGLSFELAHDFDWNSALVIEDARQDYSETRYQALGTIDGRLYMLVFTVRGEAIRVITPAQGQQPGDSLL